MADYEILVCPICLDQVETACQHEGRLTPPVPVEVEPVGGTDEMRRRLAFIASPRAGTAAISEPGEGQRGS